MKIETHPSRYLFSPQIRGSLDFAEATLDLAICCITYLCQRHHDPDRGDERIADDVISGAYRFHNFATAVWLELVKNSASQARSGSLPTELISSLEDFMYQRTNDFSTGKIGDSPDRLLEPFKSTWPDIHLMLSKITQFHHVAANSDFDKREGTST